MIREICRVCCLPTLVCFQLVLIQNRSVFQDSAVLSSPLVIFLWSPKFPLYLVYTSIVFGTQCLNGLTQPHSSLGLGSCLVILFKYYSYFNFAEWLIHGHPSKCFVKLNIFWFLRRFIFYMGLKIYNDTSYQILNFSSCFILLEPMRFVLGSSG